MAIADRQILPQGLRYEEWLKKLNGRAVLAVLV